MSRLHYIFSHLFQMQEKGDIYTLRGQKRKKKVKFTTTSDGGLDPEINYTTSVFINDVNVVKARGISKKKAEEKAAKRAYYALNLKH